HGCGDAIMRGLSFWGANSSAMTNQADIGLLYTQDNPPSGSAGINAGSAVNADYESYFTRLKRCIQQGWSINDGTCSDMDLPHVIMTLCTNGYVVLNTQGVNNYFYDVKASSMAAVIQII